jgi:23S rRNA (guanosine2251-2'-O)-methyltransferase
MSTIYLYGRNPLKEAITSRKNGFVERVFLTAQAEQDGKLIGLLQKHGYKHERVTEDELAHMVGRDAVHQGVAASVKESALYTTLDTVLETATQKKGNVLFVLLDELQDPHNVGAIIRSAKAFGADAVILPEHNQTQVTGTVIKSSAGMVFALPIVSIKNVNTTLQKLKDARFWIYGLEGTGDTKLSDTKFDTNTVLVIGSEGEGIRAKTLELCDFKLAIETTPDCESLNASNAGAVAMYEWYRQNN